MSAIRIDGTHLRTAATRRMTVIALPGTYFPTWPRKYARVVGARGGGLLSAISVRYQNQAIGMRPIAYRAPEASSHAGSNCHSCLESSAKPLRTEPLTPQQTTAKATIRNVQMSERRDDDAESVTNLAK